MEDTELRDYDTNAQATEDATITVCHVDEKYDLYGGRASHERNLLTVDPPERGWLGNPAKIGQNSRKEVIDIYRENFYRKLRDNWSLANAVVGLPGRRVACHCRRTTEDEPACHLDVVCEGLLDGRIFAIARDIHDISLADWKLGVAEGVEVSDE